MQNLRTGARSIWFELSKANPISYPSLQASAGTFDVAVIGGGITGLSTAAHLLSSGINKVAVIEALQIGKGVTGYSTAKVTSQHRLIYDDLTSKFDANTARVYAELNQYGLQQISDNVSRFSIPCDFSRQSSFVYTLDPAQIDTLKKEAEAASATGILKAEFTTKTSLPFPVAGAVRFDDQAQFNSYDYCIGLCNKLSEAGISIFEKSRIVEVHENTNKPHLLRTDQGGSLEAEHVVLATHLPFLDRSGHFAFVSPICSYAIAFKAPNNQEKYFPEGMYITIGDPTRSIRSAQNGSVLIVAGAGHKLGDPPGGDTENPIKELEKWTTENFGQLEKICHWMAHDYSSPDHLPYIGYLHRGSSSMYCATGFMKWGLTLGSAAGKIISDLIVKKDNLVQADWGRWHQIVDARRWDLIHSAPGVTKAQANVTKHLVGDKLKAMFFSKDIEDLEPCCGGLFKDKESGEHGAAYRDENGTLYKLKAKCEHLGCTVLWNKADRTWDCPCHGSRYNFDGEVIHGPTVKPLSKIGIVNKAQQS